MKLPHRPSPPACLGFTLLTAALMLTLSCLRDMPEDVPTQLTWDPDLAFPIGTESFGMNAQSGFDTALFDLDTVTELPRWVDEIELVMEGTVEFDLYNLTEDPEELNQILFRINLYNGFPHDALTQAWFTGLAGEKIDSLFTEGPVLAPAGKIREQGATIDPSHVRRDAVFDRDRIGPLRDATMIRFQATIKDHDPDSTLIEFYPDYQIKVDLGVMIDLTMQF